MLLLSTRSNPRSRRRPSGHGYGGSSIQPRAPTGEHGRRVWDRFVRSGTGAARFCVLRQAWLGKAGFGRRVWLWRVSIWRGKSRRAGEAWRVTVWRGEARCVAAGEVSSVLERRGMARPARQAWHRNARPATASPVKAGRVRRVSASPGSFRQAWQCRVCCGKPRNGLARRVLAGKPWHGASRCVRADNGQAVQAGHVKLRQARRGKTRPGGSGLAPSWQSRLGMPRQYQRTACLS